MARSIATNITYWTLLAIATLMILLVISCSDVSDEVKCRGLFKTEEVPVELPTNRNPNIPAANSIKLHDPVWRTDAGSQVVPAIIVTPVIIIEPTFDDAIWRTDVPQESPTRQVIA